MISFVLLIEQIESEKGNKPSEEVVKNIRNKYDNNLEYSGIYFGASE